MPKSQYYRGNGTGRDTYIMTNNGGIFKTQMKSAQIKRGFPRPQTAISRSSAKSLHYFPDGSGRDVYIKTSDGGLHNPQQTRHYLDIYKQGLR